MGRKLLLADDSVTIQKVVTLTFSSEDTEIITASDGQEALEKLEEITPDVVLLDIFMPYHDGYEVCAFIKQHPRLSHVPVILLVGAFEPFDKEKARSAGADDHLTKPFQSIKQLINKVNNLLEPTPALTDEIPSQASANPEMAASAAQSSDNVVYSTEESAYQEQAAGTAANTSAANTFTAPAASAAETIFYGDSEPEDISTNPHSTGPLRFSSTGAETMRPRSNRNATGDFGFDDAGIEVTSIVYPHQDNLAVQNNDTSWPAMEEAPAAAPPDDILFEDFTPSTRVTTMLKAEENILFDDFTAPSEAPLLEETDYPLMNDDPLMADEPVLAPVADDDNLPLAFADEDVANTETPLLMDDLLDLPVSTSAPALPQSVWGVNEPAPAALPEIQPATNRVTASGPDELLELDDLSYTPRYHVDADAEDDVLDIYEEPPVLAVPEPAPAPEELPAEAEMPGEYPLDILEPLPEPTPAVDATISATESDDQTAVPAQAISEPPAEAATPQQPRLITLADLAPDALEAIARRVVEMMSDRAVQEIAWEIVPDLAELHIKRRLDEQAL